MTGRLERLPKWAQAEIERLHRRVADLERERFERGEATPTRLAVNPGGIEGIPDFYLKDKDRVRFSFAEEVGAEDWRTFIDVRLEDGMLCIHGANALAVLPHVTNLIYVKLKDRKP